MGFLDKTVTYRSIFCSFRDSAKALAVAWLLLHAVQAFSQSTFQQADEQFVRQLTERRFFDLAEEHCLREISHHTDAEQKAIWQQRLARVYEQHAWFAIAANRSGLLNQAIEQLTEFLQQHAPSVETEFDLRLQQVSALTASVRMSVIQAEAGHLFGPATPNIQPRMLAQHFVTVDRAIVICEDLLQRLEKIRRDMEPTRVREIRDTARLALAELHSLRFRLRPDSATEPDRSDVLKAEEFASQVIRSGSPERKQRAAWLVAELALVAGTTQEFQLKIGAVTNDQSSDDHSFAPVLKIRSLLQNQEATAAINLASDTKAQTSLQIQQLAWLKLEAILGLRELAIQLEDAELLQSTAENFEAQNMVLRQTTLGVYRDAGEATVLRYELVGEVGSEVADLVEQIDRQRTSGNEEVALSLIERALNRLSAARSPRARGGLLLRAGEIHIAKQEWKTAADRLQDAQRLFETEGMSSQQAISDLLRIFCQAQIWSTATDTSAAAQKAGYIQSLEEHVAKFAAQPTSHRARDWLIKVLEPDAPHRAAQIAMDVFETEQPADQRIAALVQAGERLSALRVAAARPNDALMRRFRELARGVQASRMEFPAAQVAAVELCLLEFDTSDCGVDGWDGLALRLKDTELAVVERSQTTTETRLRWALLEAVIGARTSAGEVELQTAEQALLSSVAKENSCLPVVAFLSAQFSVQPSRVGDIWLARTSQTIMTRALQPQTPSVRAEFIRQLLPHIVRAAEITGDTALRSTALQRVLASGLNDDQLAEVVAAISQSSAGNHGNDPTLQQFWRDVIRQNAQGSELWLEASLQLATIMSETQEAEALRQVEVIDTLYPDWGNDSRKQRADALRKLLQ